MNTTAATSELSSEDIFAAISQPIPPQRTKPIYLLGSLLVGLVMLVLPVIYLGIIWFTGKAVLWHITENSGMLSGGGGRWRFVAYITPAFVGLVLVFFLIKPLFAPRRKRPKNVVVDPKKEPFLYDFVKQLCKTIKAPFPSRIEVDCQVNASAGFHSGSSIVNGKRVLVIGLPLLAGMNLNQVAGILAHEFGHFSQGAGMRLSFLVRSINAWFQRVAFERDSWDESLVALSENESVFGLIGHLCRFFVFLGRMVLRFLAFLGDIISSFFMRQMEYDADSYEIALVGSETYEATCREMMQLSVASEQSMNQLSLAWEERRLTNDLPGMICRNRQNFTDELSHDIDEYLDNEEVGIFASHPSNKDRIAVARAKNAPGTFHVDLPAAELIENWDELVEEATFTHYRMALGRVVQKKHLVSSEEILGDQDQREDELAAFRRVTQDLMSWFRPLPFDDLRISLPDDPKATGAALQKTRKVLRESARDMLQIESDYERLRLEKLQIEIASKLATDKVPFEASAYGLSRASVSAAKKKLEEIDAEMKPLGLQLKEADQWVLDRLSLALSMLEVPKVRERVENGDDLLAEASRLALVLTSIRPSIIALKSVHSQLVVMAGYIEESPVFV